MQATHLTLICHAKTAVQKLARFALDEPLEMDWQSARLSRCGQLKASAQLLCGPELRTRQTAELFSSDPHVVEALRDCDLGRWAGARIKDLQKTESEALLGWTVDPDSAPHGGESLTQLEARMAAWLTSLQSTPGHIVAITHPFIIRAALAHVLQGVSSNLIDVEPLSAVELRFHGRWRLRLPGIDPEETL
ncbi:histidine phosphatase family protein [Pseudomonas vancouverensis]|uniref:histidine phosphatase family protein n=1 Tax=Pseudomonas vancouverensis TaxID=95300 RepID=UPI003D094DFD